MGWIVQSAGRIGDMHPTRALRIEVHADGDIEVAVVDDSGLPLGFGTDGTVAAVEFCSSGGRSPKVRAALRALMLAIEEDHERHPDAKPTYNMPS